MLINPRSVSGVLKSWKRKAHSAEGMEHGAWSMGIRREMREKRERREREEQEVAC